MTPTAAAGGTQLLCVYYRVAAADHARLRAAALQMQRALAGAHPGLAAQLLCRTDAAAASDGDTHTWLETYTLAAGADHAAVATAIEAAATALHPLLAGPRHVERFTQIA